jgi:hypothetical protein
MPGSGKQPLLIVAATNPNRHKYPFGPGHGHAATTTAAAAPTAVRSTVCNAAPVTRIQATTHRPAIAGAVEDWS